MNTKYQKGNTLLATLIGTAILSLGALALVKSSATSLGHSAYLGHKFVAEQLASELVEYFRSLSGSEFQGRFTNKPTLKFCQRINWLDRNTGLVTNRDDLALIALPTPLRVNDSPTQEEYRFYSVRIVEVSTMLVRNGLCSANLPISTTSLNPNEGDNERYMVTVGVSWFENSRSPAEPREIILSTVLAR